MGFYPLTNMINIAILGLAMHMLLRLWRMGVREDASIFQVLLRTASWCCMIIGGISWLIGVSSWLAIILVPGAIILSLVTYSRHRSGENRLIISALAGAMEHKIPLSNIAYGYGSENAGESGDRARAFSRLLDSGSDLISAARQAKIHIADEAKMAYILGLEYGNPAAMLREANHLSNRWKSDLQVVLDRLFAVTIIGVPILGIFISIVTFMMLKIVPTMQQIFDDFGLELPPMTQWVITGSASLMDPSVVIFTYLTILILNLAFFIFGSFFLLNYLGWINYYPIGMRWLKGPEDKCKVLSLLAMGVERDIPITELIKSMSQHWPRALLANKFRHAKQAVEQGQPWQDALQVASFITKNEKALLNSAQQVGNLPWALRELADAKMRRHAVRIVPMSNLVIPAFVLVIGTQVFFIVIGMMLPLIDLIVNLT